MGQKTVRYSDLSGKIVEGEDGLARIVVHEHPELGDTPVEIEALSSEVAELKAASLEVVLADLYLQGEDTPVRVAVDAAAFDKMATTKSMAEILVGAKPFRRTSRTTTGTRGDRPEYAALEHAGKPHRGKVTDAERRLVRQHFDEINARLASEGMRAISLTDPEHVERYGLHELAAERSAQ